MRPLLVLVFGVSFVAPSRQERDPADVFASFVVSGQVAYYVAPPKVVLTGRIFSVEFSHDGSFAILQGDDPPKETGLSNIFEALTGDEHVPAGRHWVRLWDVRHNRLKEPSQRIIDLLIQTVPDDFKLIEWTWEPGVVLTQEWDQGLLSTVVYRVNLSDGSVKTLKTMKFEDEGWTLTASPTKPVFVLYSTSHNRPVDPRDQKTTFKFHVCRSDGTELRSGAGVIKGIASLAGWDATGENLLGRRSLLKVPGTPREAAMVVLNTATGQVTETQEKFEYFLKLQSDMPLQTTTTTSMATLGNAVRPVTSLWLSAAEPSADRELSQPQAMVAAGVEGVGWLSPSLDKVVFQASGQLLASDIVRMDLATFRKAKEAADRATAMNNAKQVALSLMIYATDYDDWLPGQGAFRDGVLPYAKNEKMLNSFVYTFQGGDITKIEDPSKTELGYVLTKGGRFVAYADSHVKFVPDP